MDISTVIGRAFAVVVGSAVAHVLFGASTVGLNLWVLTGWPAFTAGALYVLVLAAIAVDPDQVELHMAAAPLGMLFWLGRMGGFLDLVLDGRPDLAPAVHERAMIAVVVLLWHARAVRAIAVRAQLAAGRR